MNRFLILSTLTLLFLGCDSKSEKFDPNRVYALTLENSRSTPTAAAVKDVAKVIDHLFGSPNEPRWPAERFDDTQLKTLVDEDRLQQAAGPVSSDRDGKNHGLYRRHCVNCHSLAGSGAGPAALFQNPYPRDFRHGVFKWKTTERSAKPTLDDLRRLLRRGVAGTAMPKFEAMTREDLDAVVDYVVYLSVRGEVERRLLSAAIDELGYEEAAPDEAGLKLTPDAGEESEAGQLIGETVQEVAASWRDAESQVVSVPSPPSIKEEELADSLARGRALFDGEVTKCSSCHGIGGDGQAITLDYDDWTKEYSTRIGLTPTDRDAMRPFRDVGALTPRQIEPRRLINGVFRGGGEFRTIYLQIAQGIAGTPMPGVEIATEPGGKGLTQAQMWDLVRYVHFLGQ